MLTREALVQSEKTFAIEKVLTPAWAQICGIPRDECYLYARTLDATRADDVQKLAQEQQEAAKNKDGSPDRHPALNFAQWVVLGACDENGEAFFTEEDIPALLLRPLMPLVECAGAVMKLNGVTTDEPSQKEDASKDAPKVA